MWIRWTLPRPRIDQVLYTCIKVLLPLACLLIVGAAMWQLVIPEPHFAGLLRAPRPWVDFNPLSIDEWRSAGGLPSFVTQVALAGVGVGLFVATLLWVGYAWLTGGRVQPRLFEAEPIPDVKGAT